MERHYGCDCDVIHQEAVDMVKGGMLAGEVYQRLSALYKMFGDPTRLQLLHALAQRELCVCDLAALLGLTKSAVSHQLKSLRLLNLVKCRREGQNVFYSLADDHVELIMNMGLAHVME